MSTTEPIKLTTIIFEAPIQIGGLSIRQYEVSDHMPARYDAHLHGDLQCVALRDASADSTIFVPLRYVRTMEAADKHTLPASSSSSDDAEPPKEYSIKLIGGPALKVPPSEASSDYAEPPKRRGRPRTKNLGTSGDNI